jgi:cyanophycinase
VLHVLPDGFAYNLTTRTLVPTAPTSADDQVESDVEELAVAGRGLRRFARDIAAGDASPSVLRRRKARRPTAPDSEGDAT